MLQVARLAPRQLGESVGLVADYLRGQFLPNGGGRDRAGNADLYYTVFALEGLLALQCDIPVEATANYLRSFGDGEELDFVHVACLARCWAALPVSVRRECPAEAILRHVARYRAGDGGYAAESGAATGTLYGSFLALGAYQDCGHDFPEPLKLVANTRFLRSDDGGYANQADVPIGLTPSTAAAATLLRNLGEPVDDSIVAWLLARRHTDGGFFATPLAPLPDLLSTATALHALSGMRIDLSSVREGCLDFIDTLWTARGGFHGNWADDELDSEYTYYGLLALGHLSV